MADLAGMLKRLTSRGSVHANDMGELKRIYNKVNSGGVANVTEDEAAIYRMNEQVRANRKQTKEISSRLKAEQEAYNRVNNAVEPPPSAPVPSAAPPSPVMDYSPSGTAPAPGGAGGATLPAAGEKVSGLWNGAKRVGGLMGGNLMASAGGTMGGVAKALGKHALKGAVAGGALGGVMESAQGGSFWEGAKEGAWNGAFANAAYGGLRRATGATSRNPLSQDGAFRKAGQMWKDNVISKPAKILMDQQATVNVARQNMGR